MLLIVPKQDQEELNSKNAIQKYSQNNISQRDSTIRILISVVKTLIWVTSFLSN